MAPINDAVSASSDRVRIAWIDWLKILACAMVMIGHFYGAFYSHCTVSPILNHITVSIFEYFPRPLLDGNFWVCVFCVLSGVLCSNKKINKWNVLLKEITIRYFRFLIPLFLINLLVYIVFSLNGFANHWFASLYDNQWLDSFFDSASLISVLKNTVILGSGLNGPLWMLRPLFAGNVIIMVTNFIDELFLKGHKINKLILVLFVSVLLLTASFIRENCVYILAVFLGMVLTDYNRNRNSSAVFVMILVGIGVCYYIPFIDLVTTIHSLSFKNLLFSVILVYDFLNWKKSDIMKGTKIPIGSISFWLYLLHWPFICSVSTYIIMLSEDFSLGFWVSLVTTVISIIALSYLFVYTADVWIGKTVNQMNIVLNKVLFINDK